MGVEILPLCLDGHTHVWVVSNNCRKTRLSYFLSIWPSVKMLVKKPPNSAFSWTLNRPKTSKHIKSSPDMESKATKHVHYYCMRPVRWKARYLEHVAKEVNKRCLFLRGVAVRCWASLPYICWAFCRRETPTYNFYRKGIMYQLAQIRAILIGDRRSTSTPANLFWRPNRKHACNFQMKQTYIVRPREAQLQLLGYNSVYCIKQLFAHIWSLR